MTAQIALPTRESLARAAQRLRAGDLVAFPTETVYGLGADAANPDAVRKIFAAKGRPTTHPVIVHLLDMPQVEYWARDIPEDARKLAAAFWPGPLTLILPRAAHVPDVVTGGQDSVGLRVPSHPVARQLLAAFAAIGGQGIAGPSANRFGRISPTTARHVADDQGDAVALILDGGACDVGIESTIVAFDGSTPMLLRPGGIDFDDLVRVLGSVPRAPDARAPRVSGSMASHYAPRTPARIVAAASLASDTRGSVSVAVLSRTVPRPAAFTGTWIVAPADAHAYAHELYANLRSLDDAGAAAILIEDIPEDSAWLAVRDRLQRAASRDCALSAKFTDTSG
jgi:L-threonylcarbamoyladenylate synthase